MSRSCCRDAVVAASSELELLFEYGAAVRRRDGHEIEQCSLQPSRDLRRFGARHPDLVERQVHVRVPVHRRHGQAELPLLVAVEAVGERPPRQLAEAVVQPVDCLDGGRRVLKRRLRRANARRCRRASGCRTRGPRSSVALEPEYQAARRRVVDRGLEPSPGTRKSGAPAGTNSPSVGTSSSAQPARSCLRDEVVGADRGDDARFRRTG